MPLDYQSLSHHYHPHEIKTLLIGEAPPPNGESYFYLPAKLRLKIRIEKDSSLPATIFNHYFGRRPEDKDVYKEHLEVLQEKGIFLIDIYTEPIRIRTREGIIIENVNKVKETIPLLPARIKKLKGINSDTKVIFLMPRPHYNVTIRKYFKKPDIRKWKVFRLDQSEVFK